MAYAEAVAGSLGSGTQHSRGSDFISANLDTAEGSQQSSSEGSHRFDVHIRQPTPQLSSSFTRSILFHPHDAGSNHARTDGILLRTQTPPTPMLDPPFSATPSIIRADTMQLSGMVLSAASSPLTAGPPQLEARPPGLSISPLARSPIQGGPSALSVLMAESRASSRPSSRSPEARGMNEDVRDPPQSTSFTADHEATALFPVIRPKYSSETQPLLPAPQSRTGTVYTEPTCLHTPPTKPHVFRRSFSQRIRFPSRSVVLHALPAVVLGLLLNILDGVSYGMIVFPSSGVFTGFGGIGVSMFFVTTIVAQLVYSLGGSGFAGANGSMMIEVVPFFHIIVGIITAELGDEAQDIIATTMAAFVLSSILTGLTFFLLGYLNLGVLIGFFPRHILVGCIGGIGVFLVETGFEITTGLGSDSISYDLDTLRVLFSTHAVARWAPAFALAVFLRFITHRWHHQLIFPLYFLAVLFLFYVIVGIAHLDLSLLRRDGWLFNMSETHESWYHFYSYFDFRRTSLSALIATLPTQFALLFFNVLHPPLNVPALAVSLDQDVDTNKELIGHGYSNFLAGFIGSVPNYLVYVNTLMFYRVGGGTRFAGFLLAVGTAILLFIGTAPIGYIPIMVVGALIFVLGIDLIKEALWDTWPRASRAEYITIASIMVCMTIWDFVIGVLFGLVVSCVFFVVQNSRTSSIRASYTGESSMSAVRRPSAHRAYIREVSQQTFIMKLQGHLFFGTITQVEARIRQLLDASAWEKSPLRFLVLDFALVAGVDLSSAEAFVRVRRLLAGRGVILVLCGFRLDSEIGKALANVDLFQAEGVEVFLYFNEALEWTENAYLKAWLSTQRDGNSSHDKSIAALPGRQELPPQLAQSMVNSPRRSHLWDAGIRVFVEQNQGQTNARLSEPLDTLFKAFCSYGPLDPDVYAPLVPYFRRVTTAKGEVIWKQGEPSDALYLIQSGVLRATYNFAAYPSFDESMVAGTIAGELSAVSRTPRNATVVVDRDAVLWRLGTDDLLRLELEQPTLARALIRLILKSAKVDYDILINALAARQ